MMYITNSPSFVDSSFEGGLWITTPFNSSSSSLIGATDAISPWSNSFAGSFLGITS